MFTYVSIIIINIAANTLTITSRYHYLSLYVFGLHTIYWCSALVEISATEVFDGPSSCLCSKER